MTSIVGRLAKTLSQGPDDAPCGRGHALAGGAALGTGLTSPRLSASRSFNDFSLSVHEDAEEEYRSAFVGLGAVKTAAGNGGDQPQDALCHESAVGSQMVGGVLRPKDAGAAAAAGAHIPVRPKARSVKVMGMDAYDYCDLLRSGSL